MLPLVTYVKMHQDKLLTDAILFDCFSYCFYALFGYDLCHACTTTKMAFYCII